MYIRRDTWRLYSPEPSDCSGYSQSQFWASTIIEISQPLDNLCQCSITHTVEVFHDIQPIFSKAQFAAVASHLSPVHLQEESGSLHPEVVADSGKTALTRFCSKGWINLALSLYPGVICFIPWAFWCLSLQNVNFRFYKLVIWQQRSCFASRT